MNHVTRDDAKKNFGQGQWFVVAFIIECRPGLKCFEALSNFLAVRRTGQRNGRCANQSAGKARRGRSLISLSAPRSFEGRWFVRGYFWDFAGQYISPC